MKIAACLFAFLAFAVPAAAQHPCDVDPPSQVSVAQNESIKIGFCHPGKDPAGAAIVDFQLVGTGAAPISVGVPPVVGAPHADGRNYYETASFPAQAGGTFSIVAVGPSGTSVPSRALTVSLINLPVAPTGLRIER